MPNTDSDKSNKYLDKAIEYEQRMLDADSDEDSEKARKSANMAWRAAVRYDGGTLTDNDKEVI